MLDFFESSDRVVCVSGPYVYYDLSPIKDSIGPVVLASPRDADVPTRALHGRGPGPLSQDVENLTLFAFNSETSRRAVKEASVLQWLFFDALRHEQEAL